MLIRLVPPANTTYVCIGGETYHLDGDGTILMPGKYCLQLLSQGYAVAADDILTGDAAAIPATSCVAGLNIFDTVRGKPLWRSAGNDHWLDATGAVVI